MNNSMTFKILFNRSLTSLVSICLLTMVSYSATAEDWSKLSTKKQTSLGLYMTSQQSYNYIMKHMDNTLFIDIRTPSEVNYLGATSVMDANVPIYTMDGRAWDDKKSRYVRKANKNFVNDINTRLKNKGLKKSDTVILICRSGKRSVEGVKLLAKNGYKKVYSVVDGYEGDKLKSGENKGKRFKNGWKNSGLPWTYSMDKDLMHFTK